MEPLFHSYVFVCTTTAEHALIKQLDGVITFVYWLGNPAVIRDEEILTIREFLNEYENVKLEKAQVNINDIVRIKRGPFEDKEGSVVEVKHKTVKVYLPSLGYQLLAEIEKTNIKIINANLELTQPVATS